jgi:mannose-6-phosphate isomerase-like protein (cupin superfamily)
MTLEARTLAGLLEQQRSAGRGYLEFVRAPSMSVGLYVLEVGDVDGQVPHREDEVYVVLAGRSRFTAGDEERDVARGDVIFVAAGIPHRFHDIEEQLQLIVVFAPPES